MATVEEIEAQIKRQEFALKKKKEKLEKAKSKLARKRLMEISKRLKLKPIIISMSDQEFANFLNLISEYQGVYNWYSRQKNEGQNQQVSGQQTTIFQSKN